MRFILVLRSMFELQQESMRFILVCYASRLSFWICSLINISMWIKA